MLLVLPVGTLDLLFGGGGGGGGGEGGYFVMFYFSLFCFHCFGFSSL